MILFPAKSLSLIFLCEEKKKGSISPWGIQKNKRRIKTNKIKNYLFFTKWQTTQIFLQGFRDRNLWGVWSAGSPQLPGPSGSVSAAQSHPTLFMSFPERRPHSDWGSQAYETRLLWPEERSFEIILTDICTRASCQVGWSFVGFHHLTFHSAQS